ncbi:hypothetical protein J3Q64DRAFT_1745158 [Phycomyces blakesleeanus]
MSSETQSLNTAMPSTARQMTTTDGVFCNLSAKPESEANSVEEAPPTYDVATADRVPPYRYTTIVPIPIGDMILVEGIPVGDFFHFFLNFAISYAFQIFGFLLTYMVHTSHATKQGSLAGLGLTMVTYSSYLNNMTTGDGDVPDDSAQNAQDSSIESSILLILGWFLIMRSVLEYTRARKLERAIAMEQAVEDSIV